MKATLSINSRRRFIAVAFFSALLTIPGASNAASRGSKRVGGHGSSGKGGHYVKRAPTKPLTKSTPAKKR